MAISALLAIANVAAAQPLRPIEGRLGVGVSISRIEPAAAELSPRTRIRPSLRRLPSQGFGAAFAFNWFDAEIGPSFEATEVPFGRIVLRPVMAGIAYTHATGRVAISPSFVAGPALATLDVDERLEERFAVTGNGFERNVGRVTPAFRAGVNVTYALAPRLALAGFGGYLWSRPSFALSTPGGNLRRMVRADAMIVDAGLVVSLF